MIKIWFYSVVRSVHISCSLTLSFSKIQLMVYDIFNCQHLVRKSGFPHLDLYGKVTWPLRTSHFCSHG